MPLGIFLSTLSLRRATNGHPDTHQRDAISIHALLAESDRVKVYNKEFRAISIHALLAESDNDNYYVVTRGNEFLSTLSLRRATGRAFLD